MCLLILWIVFICVLCGIVFIWYRNSILLILVVCRWLIQLMQLFIVLYVWFGFIIVSVGLVKFMMIFFDVKCEWIIILLVLVCMRLLFYFVGFGCLLFVYQYVSDFMKQCWLWMLILWVVWLFVIIIVGYSVVRCCVGWKLIWFFGLWFVYVLWYIVFFFVILLGLLKLSISVFILCWLVCSSVLVLVYVRYIGGCGFWNGFGWIGCFGILMYWLLCLILFCMNIFGMRYIDLLIIGCSVLRLQLNVLVFCWLLFLLMLKCMWLFDRMLSNVICLVILIG